MTMLFRIAMQAAFGFCALVSIGSMGASVFVFYFTLKMTSAALKEQPEMVKLGRKIGMGTIILSVLVTCAGIGSLLF